MNIRIPEGTGDFARLLVESIGLGLAQVSTVDGIGGGLLLAGLLTAVVGVVAAFSSGWGTDESAPILRECDR